MGARVEKVSTAKCVHCSTEFERRFYAGKPQLQCHECHTEYRALQKAAVLALSNARRRGLVPTYHGQPCADCSKPAQCHDHRDYTKPLEVVPVCYSCNARRGLSKFSREQVSA